MAGKAVIGSHLPLSLNFLACDTHSWEQVATCVGFGFRRRFGGCATGGESALIEFDECCFLVRKTLEDAALEDLGRKGQMVRDGAEHDRVAQPDVAEFLGNS